MQVSPPPTLPLRILPSRSRIIIIQDTKDVTRANCSPQAQSLLRPLLPISLYQGQCVSSREEVQM